MSKFKEIERRFEVGYAPSVYGTVSNARLQMHNDLKYLINEFKKLNIHSVSYSLDDWNSEEDEHWDEYEDPNAIND